MGRTKEAGSFAHKRSKGKDRGGSVVKTGFDGPLQAPCRKTVSIFKQPVTLVHTTRRETKSTSAEQLRRGTRGGRLRNEKPHQVKLTSVKLIFFFEEYYCDFYPTFFFAAG